MQWHLAAVEWNFENLGHAHMPIFGNLTKTVNAQNSNFARSLFDISTKVKHPNRINGPQTTIDHPQCSLTLTLGSRAPPMPRACVSKQRPPGDGQWFSFTPVSASAASLWFTVSHSQCINLGASHCEWFPKVLTVPHHAVLCLMCQMRHFCIALNCSVHHFCVRRCLCIIHTSFKAIHRLELFSGVILMDFTFVMLLEWQNDFVPCLPIFCQNPADKMHACHDTLKVCHDEPKGHASSPTYWRSP